MPFGEANMSLDQTTMIHDIRTEDDKLEEALGLAFGAMDSAKEDRREAKAAQDDENQGGTQVVLPGSTTPIQLNQSV